MNLWEKGRAVRNAEMVKRKKGNGDVSTSSSTYSRELCQLLFQSYSQLCSVNNVLKISLNELKIELEMVACAATADSRLILKELNFKLNSNAGGKWKSLKLHNQQ